jgi:hypothetical protein
MIAGLGGGDSYGGAPADLMQEGAPLGLYRVHAALAVEVQAIKQRYRVPVIATKHLLLPGASSPSRLLDAGTAAGTVSRPHYPRLA